MPVERRVLRALTCVLALGLAASTVLAEKIYWTDSDTDKVQRANLDGSVIKDLMTTRLGGPQGIALDVSAGEMYWVDETTGSIGKANMDGTGTVTTVLTGLVLPRDLALDVAAGKMYWTESGPKTVKRADTDGTDIEVLVSTGLSDPQGIALDVSAGKMYWVDSLFSKSRILMAKMDGTGRVTTLLMGLSSPIDIALDVSAGEMYWSDKYTGKIQKANMDGTGGVRDPVTGKNQKMNIDGTGGVTDVVTGQKALRGIALDVASGHVYWTDFDTRNIQRGNMDGTGSPVELVADVSGPSIALDLSSALPLPPRSRPGSSLSEPGENPNLETARVEALAFAHGRGFLNAKITEIHGRPWKVTKLTLSNGNAATEYQWLGPGKGGHFVHVTIDEITGEVHVEGGFSED